MDVLRTPDERFDDLEGFPFEPNYVEVDDGDGGRLLLLCMHGQPTWSYLYRKMIPPLTDAGYRVIAPDLLGFGRSDAVNGFCRDNPL